MRRLFKNKDGSTAMEFAFAGPPLILMIIGALEMLIVLFVGSSLESAVLDASRYGITGNTEAGVTREEQVLSIISERTFGLVDVDDAQVQMLVYPSFQSIGQPEPYTDTNSSGSYDFGEPLMSSNGNSVWDADMGATGLGGPGDVVVYRVTYEWGMITPFFSNIVGPITHTSSVVVRNEPY